MRAWDSACVSEAVSRPVAVQLVHAHPSLFVSLLVLARSLLTVPASSLRSLPVSSLRWYPARAARRHPRTIFELSVFLVVVILYMHHTRTHRHMHTDQ